MDATTQGLTKLREDVFEQMIPLLDNDSIPVEDRFRLILQIAQTKGSLELYQKAFQIAQNMENGSRLDAYLDLLADIDDKLQNTADNQPANTSQDQTPNEGYGQ